MKLWGRFLICLFFLLPENYHWLLKDRNAALKLVLMLLVSLTVCFGGFHIVDG